MGAEECEEKYAEVGIKVRCKGEGGGDECWVAHRKSLIIHLRIVRTFATERTNL